LLSFCPIVLITHPALVVELLTQREIARVQPNLNYLQINGLHFGGKQGYVCGNTQCVSDDTVEWESDSIREKNGAPELRPRGVKQTGLEQLCSRGTRLPHYLGTTGAGRERNSRIVRTAAPVGRWSLQSSRTSMVGRLLCAPSTVFGWRPTRSRLETSSPIHCGKSGQGDRGEPDETVTIVADGRLIQYWRDGQKIFEMVDPQPLWVGSRGTRTSDPD
jgi:hypothetical protein